MESGTRDGTAHAADCAADRAAMHFVQLEVLLPWMMLETLATTDARYVACAVAAIAEVVVG
jgi:hypothetical protein